MRQEIIEAKAGRRRFLGLATAGAAAGTAAVIGLPEAKAEAPATAGAAHGYHETTHVRTYYASARF